MTGNDTWSVRLMANAGLVLKMGSREIGVDLFCRDAEGQYEDLPRPLAAELLQEITEGKMDTLIFTHDHSDHFYIPDVLQALGLSETLRVISTPQVCRLLRQQGISSGRMDEIPFGTGGEICTREMPECRLGLFYAGHEGEQYADVQNLCILAEGAPGRLVITGDAAASPDLFAGIARWSPDIDWLFAPFPYVGLPSARHMLEEQLRVQHIFALHQPVEEADSLGWRKNTRRVCRQAKDGLPDPIFPGYIGEWYKLS